MEGYLENTEKFLAEGNLEEAEISVNRASLLLNDMKENIPLVIQYKTVYAHFLNCRGKFMEAAQRCYELSLKTISSPADRRTALQNALTCTLLAPPSNQQIRLLATLYKDERCENLAGHSILKDMYLERLIKYSDLTAIESSLAPHQKVIDADGFSILQRSVMEQNMRAAGKLFANISFDGLGDLLGVPAVTAEKIATKMISTDRLKGSIDQLEQIVYFETHNRTTEWDSNIVSICELVNLISERISAKHPELVSHS